MDTAERTQEPQTEEPAEQQLPEGQILHTLSDDDDDDSDVDTSVLDKRGKRSWAREMKAKEKQWETEKAEMTERLAKLEGQASRPQTVYQPPVQQQQAPDPIKQRLTEITRLKSSISAQISDPKQQVDFAKAQEAYEELENERIALVMRQQQPRQQQQPQMSYEETVMRAEFPDMFPDQGGRMDLYHEVNAEFIRLKGAGKAHSLGTMKDAAAKVFQRHGIGQKAPPPTNGEKAKLSGTPGRAGASGQNGNQVALTKQEVGAALSYFNGATGKYSAWSDKQKVDYWYKNVKMKGGA